MTQQLKRADEVQTGYRPEEFPGGPVFEIIFCFRADQPDQVEAYKTAVDYLTDEA